MSERDPPRMIHDPAASDAARTLLRGALDDGPSAESLAQIAARAKATAPTVAPLHAPRATTIMKPWFPVVALGVASLLGLALASKRKDAPNTTVVARVTDASAEHLAADVPRIEPRAAEPARGVLSPTVTAEPLVDSGAAPVHRRCVESEHVDRIGRAQRSLVAGDPRAALAATREDAASCAQRGSMVEERERIAIQALFESGATSAARARWRVFAAQFPNSPYGLRLRALFSGP